MRTGPVIDGSLRSITSAGTERRNRITGLILELATEYHQTGSIRNHSDPSDATGWNVKNIETCADPLCVEAVAAVRDIEDIARHFPIGRDLPT